MRRELRIAFFILAAGFFKSPFAKTQLSNCTEDLYRTVRTCDFYINPTEIVVSAIDVGASNAQLQNQWCWAASLEMAFRYWGYFIPQAQIVSDTWGSVVNMPAYPSQVLAAVNRAYIDNAGKSFQVKGAQLTDWIIAAVALGADIPVLVGSQGHMTLILGLEYKILLDFTGQPYQRDVVDVVVFDPWPGNGIRHLTPMEFYAANTLISVNASPIAVSVVKKTAPHFLAKTAPYDVLGRTYFRR